MEYVTAQDIVELFEALTPAFIFVMTASFIVYIQVLKSAFIAVWNFFERRKNKINQLDCI